MEFRFSILKFFIFLFFLFSMNVSFGYKKIIYKKSKLIQKNIQLRGVWLTTAFCLDWPPVSSINFFSDKLRIKEQKRILISKLDNLVKIGINTIFFQVKPDCMVFYRSKISPYSNLITGIIGKNPGYDPLRFVLIEGHKRNLKIHAWINPYRVSLNSSSKTINLLKNSIFFKPLNVYLLHKNWIRFVSNYLVLDPGLPEVRNWIVSIVIELIKNYNIDGIQFDDYFYHESSSSVLNDNETFKKNNNFYLNKADWRRNNTFLLIKNVSLKIRSIKPNIEFGISPSGVWRNFSQDIRGSKTNVKNSSYDFSYADIRLWIKKGLLDYVAPQVYYSFSNKEARYDVIVRWWANLVRFTKTKLYIGIALYKIGLFNKKEPEWSFLYGIREFKKQLDFNERFSEIKGVIFFRENFFSSIHTKKVVEYLRFRWN